MNYLSDICFLCVEHNQNLTNIALKDTDGFIIQEKLKCFILELANFEPYMPKYMCHNCMENLNHAYKFRLKCLKNIPILNEYLQKRLANKSKHKTTVMTRAGKSRTIEELGQTKSLDTIVIKKEIEEILETPATIDEPDQEIALENVIVKSEYTEEIHAKKDNAINTNKTTSLENVKTEVNEEISKSEEHVPFEYVEINESRDIQKLQLLSEEGNTGSFSKNITNNNVSADNDSDDEYSTPPESSENANKAPMNSLPKKSAERYQQQYALFNAWKSEKNEKSSSESVLLAYLQEKAAGWKSSTMWSNYSMLRSMIALQENVNIAEYQKLAAFLKRHSTGYVPKKPKVLTAEQIQKFLTDAPDAVYLATKVVLIFGFCGGCRKEELKNIKITDIEKHGKLILVKVPKTKSNLARSFTIAGEFRKIVAKYEKLRPPSTQTDRFFLNYQKGKCTVQVIGKNKFYSMPKQIAQYLGLPDAESYTGHSFRRTSSTQLTDAEADMMTLQRLGGWKTSAEMITSEIVLPSTSTASQDAVVDVETIQSNVPEPASRLSAEMEDIPEIGPGTGLQTVLQTVDEAKHLKKKMKTDASMSSRKYPPPAGNTASDTDTLLSISRSIFP